MVRARGGLTRSREPTRKQKKAPNTPKESRKPRKYKKKSHKKFADYAKNFVDDSDSESTTSQQSLSSVDGSIENINLAADKYGEFSETSASMSWFGSSIDPASIPGPLLLPQSSNDLLIESKYLFQTLEVYEAVRHFGRVLKISTFGFEDFCAALLSKELSPLISEIHLSLLKAVIALDETCQINHGSLEEKDMVSIQIHLIDEFTWPEVLRYYANSDPDFNFLVPIVEDLNYPTVAIQDTLKVLSWLVNCCMMTPNVREEIANEGLFISDDHCRKCMKMGELLCCELCPAVYHLDCLNPSLDRVPDNEWFCPVCDANKVKGVTDALTELDRFQVYRNEPFGSDRHGRVYWFMIRRVIV